MWNRFLRSDLQVDDNKSHKQPFRDANREKRREKDLIFWVILLLTRAREDFSAFAPISLRFSLRERPELGFTVNKLQKHFLPSSVSSANVLLSTFPAPDTAGFAVSVLLLDRRFLRRLGHVDLERDSEKQNFRLTGF